ncbi:MAG: hypothetical protein F7C32_02195 [Desulfurococcales archaeon]|nr:hypothetical protein [Desulfurococcales archaeon]
MGLLTRISPITFLILLVSLATIATAAAVYTGGEFPYSYKPLGEPFTPLSSWAGNVVGATSSRGTGIVEGRPVIYGHMGMPEVNNTVIMPKPGTWEASDGEELCHMDVLRLIATADYIVAKGVVYEQLVYLHAEPHKALVATEIEAVKQGHTIQLHYEEPDMCMGQHNGMRNMHDDMHGGMDDDWGWGRNHDNWS